jgi:cytochrome b6-f complex iron-sulfur subunit
MNRRDFIGWLYRAIWGIWGGVGLYIFGRFLAPKERSPLERGTRKVAKVKDIPAGDARLFYVDGEPILVVHAKENQFVALSPICTHLRCGVVWDREGQKIRCPCHGGTFDALGNVISGPPPKPLKRYAIEIRNGDIYVEKG